MNLRDRLGGALIGGTFGDAMGRANEGMWPSEAREQGIRQYQLWHGCIGRDVPNLRKMIFLTGTPERRARAFPQEYGRALLAVRGAMSKRAPKTIEAPLPAGLLRLFP